MSAVTIDARAVSKRFLLRHNRAASLKVRFLSLLHARQREVVEEFWALRDLSLSIGGGDAVGLIGRNGSGKSTFLKLIAGIHRPTSGSLLVRRDARIGTMIELGIGFHPDLNGTENVFLNAAIHGLSREQIEAIYPRIVEFSGLRHFMDVPLKNYSSGMHMRLGFAIAANLDPDILLLDEIFAVGDEDFQRHCMKTMRRFAAEGRTLVFVSHTPSAVRSLCRRVCVLDQGRLVFDGDVDAGLHEYQRLLAAGSDGSDAAGETIEAGAESRTIESIEAAGPATDRGWAVQLLQSEGLQPHHHVLEVSCGGDVDGSVLAGHVAPSHFQRWDIDRPLDGPLQPFDYALASPLLSRVSLNAAARCAAVVLRAMRPGARLYATWRENPDPMAVPDTPPFNYPFEILAGLGDALGADVERVSGGAHPDGESVIVILPRREKE